MSFSYLFFSFNGRIPRSSYWLGSLGLSLAVLLIIAVAMVLNTELLLVLVLPVVFCGAALAVKRLHDRDRTGLWILVFYFVPGILDRIARVTGDVDILFWLASFAIGVWALVELGFLRGTPGPNRYGPDPLMRLDAA